jgi:hypothetical protein
VPGRQERIPYLVHYVTECLEDRGRGNEEAGTEGTREPEDRE